MLIPSKEIVHAGIAMILAVGREGDGGLLVEFRDDTAIHLPDVPCHVDKGFASHVGGTAGSKDSQESHCKKNTEDFLHDCFVDDYK